MGKRDEPNIPRWVLVGVGFFVWNIVVVTLAILITARTQGENVGKFFGTVGSAIAFGPPAWFVWRWYQQHAAQDRQQVTRFHLDHAKPTDLCGNSAPHSAVNADA